MKKIQKNKHLRLTYLFLATIMTTALLTGVIHTNSRLIPSYEVPHNSSSYQYHEDFFSTDYMEISNTTAEGWGMGNLTLPEKNFILSQINEGHQDIFLEGEIAYISTLFGVYIYDVSNPYSPLLLGYNSTEFTLENIYVDRGYLFGASWYWDEGVFVYDVSDTQDISLVTYIDNYVVDSYWDEQICPVDIWVLNEGFWRLFVWDEYHGLISLIFAEPDLLIQAGGYDPFDDGGTFNSWASGESSLYIQGDIAYASSTGGLEIIDISDRDNPIGLSQYAYGRCLTHPFVSGELAYIGSVKPTHPYEFEFLEIVNVSDPSNPYRVGVSETLRFYDISYIRVVGNKAYTGFSKRVSDDPNPYGYYPFEHGFSIFDISDPTNITLTYSFTSYSNSMPVSWNYQGYYTILISGNYAYMSDGPHFFIVDISLIGQYESEAVAQSTEIFSGSNTEILSQATLAVSASIPGGTSLSYYLSSDNGTHWEQVTLGLAHLFTNIGNILKWRISLSSSALYSTPRLYSLDISYDTVLIAPTLITPVEDELTSNPNPYFEWQTLSGAISYLFQLDTSTSFTTQNLINLTTNNHYYTPITPLDDGIWYWRVAAIDSEGDIGIFSNHRTLIVDAPPGIPILIDPDDESYINLLRPTFSWISVSDAVNYTLQLDTSISFSSIDLINYTGITSTSFQIGSDLYDDEWYWRVCAFDSSGNQGIYSNISSLIVDTIIPTIDHPEDISYTQGSSGNTIIWNGFDIHPSSYIITRDAITLREGLWTGNSITINIDGLSIGTYSFNCTVIDKAGNFRSDIVIVKVSSKQQPKLLPIIIGTSVAVTIAVISIPLIIKKLRRREK
ncbi:MAG: hypothetical protein ACFFAQ_11870 [Promethearchaeota archaeon]